jgi:SchA/CurD like domain
MSQWVALMWGIKPESRDAVRELFASYGRPDHAIKDDDGNEVGTLLQTLVFMKDDQVIRVVETTDGVDLPTLAKHMGRQPAIRELEDQLDEHIAEPRDMSTPEGAREFFVKCIMEPIAARRHDE